MDGNLPRAAESSDPSTAGGRRRASFFDLKASALTPSEGWVTVALLLAMSLVLMFTVQKAEWVTPMPRLWLVAILALLLGLGAAKVRGPILLQVLVHLLVLGIGLGVVLTETANTLTGSPAAKFDEMFTRLEAWVRAISTQGISNDRLPFVFFLASLAWLATYLSALFTFRLRWPWVAVIPAAMAFMTQQTYLPRSHYYLPLLFFLLFAILFLGRMYFLNRTTHWKVQGLDQHTRRYAYLANVLILTLAVLGSSWIIPTQKIRFEPLRDTYRTARAPWSDLEDDFERMFAGIESRKGAPLHSFGNALPLRGKITLGTKELFQITTDYPSYWRAQSYDFYQGRGWIAHEDQRTTVEAEELPPIYPESGFEKREVVAQRVDLKSESRVIFASGEPIEVSIPTEVEITIPKVYEIPIGGNPDAELPQDLLEAATQIAISPGHFSEIVRFIPQDTRILRQEEDTWTVARAPPRVPDILAVRSTKKLKPESSYEVLSSVSVATEEDLRDDSAVYPKWVTDSYLQLPAELPDRVRQLASELTEGLANPYDKALAIRSHLHSFQESYDIELPPLNADAVDHFLFTQQAGYSDYFASATAVLLRASGVPARLATGYASGIEDTQSSSFTVRVSDAHSWVEVYFPTYGWIPFEPLPSRQPIGRGPLAESTSGGGPSGIDLLLLELLLELESQEGQVPSDGLLPEAEPQVGNFAGSVLSTIGLAVGSLAGLVFAVGFLFVALWQVNFIGLPYGYGIYSRMAKLGALTWRAPHHTETPMEYAASLSAAAELRPDRARVIAMGFVKSRYGDQPLSTEEKRLIEQAWRGIRRALARRVFHRISLRGLFSRGA